MTLRELRERRRALALTMKGLNDAAEAADRGLTDEERSKWDALATEINTIDERIRSAEQLSDIGDLSRQDEDESRFEAQRKTYLSDIDSPHRVLTSGEVRRAFSAWAGGCQNRDDDGARLAERHGWPMRSSTINLVIDRGIDDGGSPVNAPRNLEEARAQFRRRRELRNEAQRESRAQSLTAAAGGNTVPNEGMLALESALLAYMQWRPYATVISTATGAALPIPTTNDTSNKGEIIAENTAVNEQDLTFGQLVLDAYKYSSKMIRCSVELLQDSSIDVAAVIFDKLGERIARILADHFTTGTGTAQPRGVVAAAANSSVTAAGAGVITYAELLGLKHSVNPAYRINGRFMCNDATLLVLKKMQDAQNRPLWSPSWKEGEPDTIDGDRVIVNQSMAGGAAAKGLIYGDFSKYLMREVKTLELMRLDERYAELHQVAFLGYGRFDGDLLDAGTNPVKYLTTT